MRAPDVVLLAVVLAGAARPALAQEDAKAVERGKAVYPEQKCSLCHAVAGKGNPKGPLDDVGSKLTADEIRAWLLTPRRWRRRRRRRASQPCSRSPRCRRWTWTPSSEPADVEEEVARARCSPTARRSGYL